jgi:precorrin-2 dehydrogenase/sirohydrochlorin ferrochelatase
LFLDISGKMCVVVGGGRVAERKVRRLLSSGATVLVVAKALTPFLQKLSEENKIVYKNKDYARSFLSGAFLVIAATSDAAVNRQIGSDARSDGVLANVVDDPEQGDFIVPSLLERGELVIAVSTGGRSPALAKKIREEPEELYGPEYSVLLRVLGELRGKIIASGQDSDENRKLFESAVYSEILDYIRAGRMDEIDGLIYRLTGVEMEVNNR